jgi:hypothetical protein
VTFVVCVDSRKVPAMAVPRPALSSLSRYEAEGVPGSLAGHEQGKIAVAQCRICIRADKLLHLTGLCSSDDD